MIIRSRQSQTPVQYDSEGRSIQKMETCIICGKTRQGSRISEIGWLIHGNRIYDVHESCKQLLRFRHSVWFMRQNRLGKFRFLGY